MTETNMKSLKYLFLAIYIRKRFLTPVLENYASKHKHTDTNNHTIMSMVGMEYGSKGAPHLRIMFYFSFKKNSSHMKQTHKCFKFSQKNCENTGQCSELCYILLILPLQTVLHNTTPRTIPPRDLQDQALFASTSLQPEAVGVTTARQEAKEAFL